MMQNPIKIHEFFSVVSGASLKKHHHVLDLGCGKGFQTQLLAAGCEKVIGVDIQERPIQEAYRFLRHSPVEDKVKFICTSLEEANLPPSSLDRVFSFCVLEHIPNLGGVLAEIVRLLKPGGELHVSVDSLATVKDPELLAKHRQEHFVNQYFTAASLNQQLRASGLQVLEIFPIFTGEFARHQFEERIRRGSFGQGMINRVLSYKRLRDEDKHSSSKEGIMLVARARRPLTDDKG
jgi:2-polyprenyl-3-methyl-5-hydroxy-6-metoxy-1,4-benzoquinol methylase